MRSLYNREATRHRIVNVYPGSSWGDAVPTIYEEVNSMFQYPTDFPTDDAKNLLGLMGGTTKPTNDTIRSAWAVGGYALSQVAPIPTIKGGKEVALSSLPKAQQVDKKKVCQALKVFVETKESVHQHAQSGSGVATAWPSVPWADLFVLLMHSLQEGIDLLVNANT